MRKFTSFLLAALMSVVIAVPAMAHGNDDNERSENGLKLGVSAQLEQRDARLLEAASIDPVKLACVATAVDAREAAVVSPFTTYSASVTAALSTRRTSLAAAYKLTDSAARRDAVKAAFKTFRDTTREARKVLQTARRDAWKSFKSAVKTCDAGVKIYESEHADNV